MSDELPIKQMDPITLAIFAVISAGVLDGATELSWAPVKRYIVLKALLKQKYGGDSALSKAIENLEMEPESNLRKIILMEEVAAAKANEDLEILKAAQNLIEALEDLGMFSRDFQDNIIIIGKNNEQMVIHTDGRISLDLGGNVENGKFMGHGKTTRTSADNSKELRVDLAVPRKVLQEHSFVMAVAIRKRSSPLLKDVDLPKLKSGDLKVNWPEDVPYIQMRIHISAPECEILGNDEVSFNLAPDQDSPVFHFMLVPQKAGPVNIVVSVYQMIRRTAGYLGSAYIQTIVSNEQIATVIKEQLAGSVQVNVESVVIYIDQSTTVGNINDSTNIAIGPQASIKQRNGAAIARHMKDERKRSL